MTSKGLDMLATLCRWVARRFEPRCHVVDGPRTPDGYVDPEAMKNGQAFVCLRRAVATATTNVHQTDRGLWWTAIIPTCPLHREPWVATPKPDRRIVEAVAGLSEVHFALDAGAQNGKCWRLELMPFAWLWWGLYPSIPGTFYLGPLRVCWPVKEAK